MPYECIVSLTSALSAIISHSWCLPDEYFECMPFCTKVNAELHIPTTLCLSTSFFGRAAEHSLFDEPMNDMFWDLPNN